ncbi:excalibur calcium-binding domain-containing protein [Psychromicrobium sp. YIM B11713]|uniref:excalibur calcium-binding domain-containing protein n=1 Tax=Psychromicrobium sp. YIM B11713 TaxID=3145233 RepID=UPI00374EBB0E
MPTPTRIPSAPSTTKPEVAAPQIPAPRPLVQKPAPAPVPAPKPLVKPAPAPQQTVAPPPAGVYYANCAEARKAGAAPLHIGQPGYRPKLDGDHDGVACERN